MDLIDLLSSGGKNSVQNLGSALGLDARDASKVVESLAPALLRGIQNNAADKRGLDSLNQALESGNHTRYVDEPETLHDEDTRVDGNKILGHIFGSKDVSRNVAAHAAESSGFDAGLLKKALPLVAALAMGTLSKKSDAARTSNPVDSGMLGGLLGSSDGDFGLDDVIGMARKLF